MDRFDMRALRRRASFFEDVKHLFGADKSRKPRNPSATVKDRVRALGETAGSAAATAKQRIRVAPSRKDHR